MIICRIFFWFLLSLIKVYQKLYQYGSQWSKNILGCQNISFILKYFLKYCNISHQCTSDQTCFDKGRSSLSCAQSRTLHRSPVGPLPYSTWVYSITIYIKICFTCMWSFFLVGSHFPQLLNVQRYEPHLQCPSIYQRTQGCS